MRTVPFAIPRIPNHPRGLMLPVLLRLDASGFDGYRDHVARYGLALTRSLTTQLAKGHRGGSDFQHPARKLLRRVLRLQTRLRHEPIEKYERALSAIYKELHDAGEWKRFDTERDALIGELARLHETHDPASLPWAVNLRPMRTEHGLVLVETEPNTDPMVRCRLEAFSAFGNHGGSIGRCKHCGRFFVPDKRQVGERYGHYCPRADDNCVQRARDRRTSQTEARKDYQRRYQKAARVGKRGSSSAANKAWSDFDEWRKQR